jgi:hypothetical protein
MRKTRTTARKPKRRSCTRKAMRGGKAEKEVTDALRNAIKAMEDTKTFPELAGALTKLANIADTNSAAVADTNSSAVADTNSAAVAADTPAVVAVDTPTAVAESENDDNSEINDSEVISYNDGTASSSYGNIISMLEKTLDQEDVSEDDKDKLRKVLIQAMQSKKPTEVQTLMNNFGTLDQVGEGTTAHYKITNIKGGTRKRRNIRTLKNKKKKGGKRK